MKNNKLEQRRLDFVNELTAEKAVNKDSSTLMKVGYILMYKNEARNNDKVLAWEYWKKWGKVGFGGINYNAFMENESYGNILRYRALVQNTLGFFPPTDEKIIKKRRIKESQIANIMNYFKIN